jgi:cell division protease FtsH
MIDQEIRKLVEEAEVQAVEMLREQRAALDEIAQVLVEREVITGEEICRIAEEHCKN